MPPIYQKILDPSDANAARQKVELAPDDTIATPFIDMVICSFALHLIKSPSELFSVLWELSTKSRWLVVLAPHKKPEVVPILCYQSSFLYICR